MDIKSWHQEIKVKLNSLDNQTFTRLQSEVVDIFINSAINDFVNTLYKQFEETQEMSDKLKPIITTPKELEIQSKVGYYVCILPKDYYYHLSSEGYIKHNNKEYNVFVTKSQIDDKSKILSDPFNRPDEKFIVITFEGGNINAYSKYPLSKFILTYLKKPIKVDYKQNISSEFSDTNVETDIIDLTVTKLLETYSSQRIQTQPKV
jgi:hypothetical protein